MYVLGRIAFFLVMPLLLTHTMAATQPLVVHQHDATSDTNHNHPQRAAIAIVNANTHATTAAPLSARSSKALNAPDASRSWYNNGAGWQMVPSRLVSWNVDSRIPMNQESANSISRIGRVDLDDAVEEGREKNKYYKKYKKYMLPLLLAYKLKFFTLVPILIGGLVLLTGATGLAGFFFALFAATMGLKGGGDH